MKIPIQQNPRSHIPPRASILRRRPRILKKSDWKKYRLKVRVFYTSTSHRSKYLLIAVKDLISSFIESCEHSLSIKRKLSNEEWHSTSEQLINNALKKQL